MAPRNREPVDVAPTEEMILKTHALDPHAQKRPPNRIVWRNVIMYIFLHLVALYSISFLPGAAPMTWIWCVFMYIFATLGITAGAHRLWSHRSYKARLPMRILLAIMQSAAFQNSIHEWARDHRVHHKYSETDADPHNAKRGFFFAHVGWLLVRKHPDVIARGKQVDLSDLKADSVVMFQKRHYWPCMFTCCFLVPTLVPCLLWGERLLTSFFTAGLLRFCLGLHGTWLVNSAAHLWGMRPYDFRINPSENTMVSVSCIGEGFHNYHHTFPMDYSDSEFGWKMNPTTAFIDTMAFLGQAYDRRKVSKEVVEQRRRRTGDLRT